MPVKVYSSMMCPWCTRAKEFLKKNSIRFEEADVQEDPLAALELRKKSGQLGVPVIDVNGEIVVGFDEKRLRQLLKIK